MKKSYALPATARFAAALASFALLSACAPKYYSANSQNVPLFTQQGQGNVAASINTDANRADIRGAIAVSPTMAIQGNGAFYFPRDEDSTRDGGSGGLLELGVGYFRPLSPEFVFETFLLGAYGGLENHFPSAANDNPGTSGKLNANLIRVALQPAIGFKQPRFEAAVSTRFAMVNYFNVGGNLVNGDGDQQQYLRDHSIQFLTEPALTVRGGLARVKIEAQVGISINMTDKDFPQDDTWSSLGVVYFFEPL